MDWTYWKRVDLDHWPLQADEHPTYVITGVYRSDGDGFGAQDMQVWGPHDHRWHRLPFDNSLRRTIWFGSEWIDPATEAEVAEFGAEVDDATAEPVAERDLEPDARLRAAYAKALPIVWPLRQKSEAAALIVAEAERLGFACPTPPTLNPADKALAREVRKD
jgi:hypothetical protein